MRAFQILLCLSSIGYALAVRKPFNPREYTKQSTTCRAIHRNEGKGEPRDVDITMSYVDLNPSANRTLLMVHGWGGLWSLWSNQIQHYKDRYRLIVPDLRGFGDSTHPGDVQASGSIGDLVGDLVCILQNANVEKVVCIGHDWGAQICYEATRMRPDIFEAVVGATLPYIPAAGHELIAVEALVAALPKLTYNLYFERNTASAIQELDNDIRRTLRATLRTVDSPPPDAFLRSRTSFLKGYKHVPEIDPIPFLSKEEEDYYVEQYLKQGFGNTLQFYTYENRYRNWAFSHEQGNFTITKPVLAIYPTADPVADWPLVALIVGAPKYLPYVTNKVLHAAHWVNSERPDEFNAIMDEWLEDLDIKLLEAELGEAKKEVARLKEEVKKARRYKNFVVPKKPNEDEL